MLYVINHIRCIFVSAIEKRTIANKKSKITKFFSISEKTKSKIQANAVLGDNGQNKSFQYPGYIHKMVSHEKPKRTNIPKAAIKTTAEKPKMSNNPTSDLKS